jgi:hypothetical protein
MNRDVFLNIWRAPRIMFAKNTVRRQVSPFELDLTSYGEADYEKIIPAMKEVERRLLALPQDRQGMRWIHQPQSVLFHGQCTFDVPYEEFVQRVDISHVGEFYRDSLSTETIVMERDVRGRPIRQGVRIVALPQPNYSSFMGKGNLDVYKLEKIDYGDREQCIWMWTVNSPNRSAACDDGYVLFRESPPDRRTVVAFLACQSFPIPPLMALARLDRWNWLKRALTENAYRRFFNVMMSNIQARYNGREFRIGRRC